MRKFVPYDMLSKKVTNASRVDRASTWPRKLSPLCVLPTVRRELFLRACRKKNIVDHRRGGDFDSSQLFVSVSSSICGIHQLTNKEWKHGLHLQSLICAPTTVVDIV